MRVRPVDQTSEFTRMQIDLNCDLGEGGAHDEALMEIATSVNIACGLHAGDPSTMRVSVERARARGLAIGAHPGYPDRQSMGRRELALPVDAIRDLVVYQVGALAALVRAARGTLHHVKLHGALYNRAARDAAVADAAAAAVAAFDPALVFVGLATTEHEWAAARAGLRFAAEAFADRTYGPDGQLTPRSDPRAFIDDPAEAAEQVLGMIRDHRVRSTASNWLPARADTICIHGDRPDALGFARALADALAAAGVTLRPLTAPPGR